MSKTKINSLLADNSVICLMAPTASGKTALAYELYDTGRFELISVDSALVYKDMNIGTAKPSQQELQQYPHHLVDIIDPTQQYSVANFVDDVQCLVQQIHERGKLPLLVGGTMMYYMALFQGLSNIPETDPVIRQKVEERVQTDGIEALYGYLAQIDSNIAQRLQPTDTQRITRAVEVYMQTGKPLSVWQNSPKKALADNPKQQWHGLAVLPDRAWLHKRIAQRLEIMWQQGLVEEVISLLHKYPLLQDKPSMRCVGYRQVIDYLYKINHPAVLQFTKIGEDKRSILPDKISIYSTISIDTTFLAPNCNSKQKDLACQDMKNQALYATRQLAKRQYTWLRKLNKLDCFSGLVEQKQKNNIRILNSLQQVQVLMDNSN
ncbi:tRNA (adenosine(37)-N6)-dimethylallyltransferase MiaA [Psychrobacter sp. I-STPA10]|uniref:tRNA (adenosine(37)-N6)-dimethylallyltransferase MiaA n=1 Tax=Psychrobacter sp. I-STPA10 TaxID=2585769 RepID=UPI001E459CA4|nr:tRNA (adenosine(37)-N6)-dimethylallyltransferase MiaA [Psychrobacter sp. I-STPA10]